ncbi:hydrogen peroxide-inducible genes activator [Xanthovirga aplysinae]|uniref:hydrogen peroxide-inducible genes activator n=1 Tax=Xanthovirga aplysinae TaxID=2529853 RepID=UPI0012BCEAF6|nr:hydrogen peroxide-inducible genes activator [Xanthovirga aplysinae]MTI30679.1 hydrogen peroxide-inducible genes activator [Xanthovirga aplysinae]
MTLTQLEYIIAVDTYRHFARAAEHCYITQPTLSMQIQKLEEELGILIFDRSKQPVGVTEIGQRIIDQARITVKEARKIPEMIADEKQGISGELKIGIIPTLAPYLLPRFVPTFLQKYPKVEVQVEELLTDEILRKIKKEELDAGILVTPVDDNLITERKIFYEDFLAYVSDKHPLFKEKDISSTELEINDVWLLNQGHCFRSQVLNICNSSYHQLKSKHFRYESGSLEALKNIVDSHGGITLLPELATYGLTEEDQEKLRVFDKPRPVREVSLVMHKSFLKKKLLEALYSEISSTVPPHMREKLKGQIIKWK